jgi:lysophospholipase L1-like esterase
VALLIAMTTHPASPLGRWMGAQPWRYIGQRSYGLYLWHWPIFMVTRPNLDVPLDGIPLLIVRLALTFGIAELSFRFVEMPIRKGAIDRWVKAWRSATGTERTRRTRQGSVIVGAAAAVVLALGLALSTAPAQASADAIAPDVAEAMGIADGGPTEVSLDDEEPSPSPAASGPSTSAGTGDKPARNPNGNLSAIGDSVMLGARNTLKEVIPGTKVDAAVSRFPGAFVGKLKRYVARDKLADVVVLHPGTNGIMPADMLREMLDTVQDVPRVVLVNTAVNRPWREPNNRTVERVTPKYDNVVVVDWYAASQDHPEYFVSDGVHLTGKGARAYAKLIKQAAGL